MNLLIIFPKWINLAVSICTWQFESLIPVHTSNNHHYPLGENSPALIGTYSHKAVFLTQVHRNFLSNTNLSHFYVLNVPWWWSVVNIKGTGLEKIEIYFNIITWSIPWWVEFCRGHWGQPLGRRSSSRGHWLYRDVPSHCHRPRNASLLHSKRQF